MNQLLSDKHGAVHYAGVALRRQSLQSRAALHLSLYQQWEAQAENRKSYSIMMADVKAKVSKKSHGKNPEQQIENIRIKCKETMLQLKSEDADQFSNFVKYTSFFEVVGHYVIAGYLPLKDVISLYKGPILELELASRDFILDWQTDALMAPGLLGNARYLMAIVHYREKHPIKHWLFHKFFLYWQRYIG